ncbi:MAG: proton-dependent oligopeptide transporter family [Verrucomicrobiaceae bacterium]|nr:proton-dependent oligopeptide transporter family [Verrucomicrobiaceae bacterium]
MSYRTAPESTARMPSGVPYIVSNEFAERFSFYGMRAVLMVFMTTALRTHAGAPDLMSEAEGTKWLHAYMAGVYFTPLLGGLIADLWLGKYKTIISLSLVYCLGHLVLALDCTRSGLFWGLTLVALGAGGIKPCVSSHVGDQFGRRNAHLLSRVYNWFYFSINVGSTVSMLLTPWLMKHYGPHVAFAVPGVLMLLATIVFWMGRHVFAHIPPQPKRFLGELLQKDFLKSLAGLVSIYVFVAMFWCLFDQTSSRWVEQAQHMDLHMFGMAVLPDQLQSLNPILVMTLIPLFSLWLYPRVNRIVEFNPLRRISTGFFIAILAFVIPAFVEGWIASGKKPSIWWQVLAYVPLTAAEILISITCLEFSYTQSPPRLKSFVMSIYYLSVALGNAFTSVVNWSIEKAGLSSSLQGAAYYWFFVKCMGVTAVLFVFVAMIYRGRAYLQEEEEAQAQTAME